MKMTPADFERLSAALALVWTPEREAAHRAAVSGACRDIEKRLRWDFFWAIPRETRQAMMDNFYTYLDDTHIDTALRRAMGNLRSHACT